MAPEAIENSRLAGRVLLFLDRYELELEGKHSLFQTQRQQSHKWSCHSIDQVIACMGFRSVHSPGQPVLGLTSGSVSGQVGCSEGRQARNWLALLVDVSLCAYSSLQGRLKAKCTHSNPGRPRAISNLCQLAG